MVNSLTPESKRWTKKYIIGEEKATFKLDTGVDVNCIPLKVVNKLTPNLRMMRIVSYQSLNIMIINCKSLIHVN